MARTTRSKAAAAVPEVVTAEAVTTEVTTSAANTNGTTNEPVKEEPKDDSRPKSRQRRGLRRKLYKKAKRHQGVEELHKATESAAGKPMSKKERLALRAQVYQPHRVRAKATTRKVSELEKLVRRQQEEIRELRKLAVGGGVPKLQPPASPPAEEEVDAEPDSSPAKIRDQLFADAALSSGGAQDGTTILEVEEVVERGDGGDSVAGEPMEGVEETTVVTSVEQDVDYPTLPSVEETTQVAEEKQEAVEEAAGAAAPDSTPKLAADTPIKSKEEVRDSSAEDSNAGTPRNVRRSPRKKAPKRRSFAGHSYVG